MKNPDFSELVSRYFKFYLIEQRNVSPNTAASYSSAISQLMEFAKFHHGISPCKFKYENLTEELVLDYLGWIENDRKCSIATRNQRLAAIHSFVSYIDHESVKSLNEFSKILKIPYKKAPQKQVRYLSTDDVRLILQQPDSKSKKGRQHLTILSLLYDSAGRVQEIADLKIRNLYLAEKKIILTGKGNKSREVPLTNNSVILLANHVKEWNLTGIDAYDRPLFVNHQYKKMTRAGIAYILKKYTDSARKYSTTIPDKVTPHIFRHSKAMHMLQAGVSIINIQDILGHSDIITTQRYAHADMNMKRKAMEMSDLVPQEAKNEVMLPVEDNLVEWLKNFSKECTDKIK